MAVKTITIDMTAYEMLAGEKRTDESFSRVIRRRLGSSHSAANLLRHLDDVCLSENGLRSVERIVKARARSLAQSPVPKE